MIRKIASVKLPFSLCQESLDYFSEQRDGLSEKSVDLMCLGPKSLLLEKLRKFRVDFYNQFAK